MSISEERKANSEEIARQMRLTLSRASEMRAKGHSNVSIAQELGIAESSVRTLLYGVQSDVLPVGAKVEFDSDGEGSLKNFGIILNHVPLEDGSVAYHIACYYVMPADMVKKTEETEYAEPWQPVEPNAMAPYEETAPPVPFSPTN